ncbi:MAG: BamA/TamA family outer membrane protein [Flavobacteriales bacterium]|nr:BamA/TamA family outer membrane protein [Flavobacteriales bacterium]
MANTQDVEITRYGLEINSSKLDALINPLKGHQISLTASAGLKTIPQEEEDDILGEQYHIHADFRKYNPVKKSFGIMGRAQYGQLFDNTSALGLNELLRVGGFNTIRGFQEEQFFAEAFGVATIQANYKLDSGTGVFAFFDQGYYQQNLEDQVEDQPYGFGLGLNIGAKAGQFNLVYALGSQDSQPVLFRNAILHFGFVNVF